MHFHVRIRHWVVLWFYVGVVFGAIAVFNILAENLSLAEIKFVLVIGVAFLQPGWQVPRSRRTLRRSASSPLEPTRMTARSGRQARLRCGPKWGTRSSSWQPPMETPVIPFRGALP